MHTFQHLKMKPNHQKISCGFSCNIPGSVFQLKIFILSLVLISTIGSLKAQDDLTVISSWIHFSDAPNALYHHLEKQATGLLKKRTEKINSINTLAGFKERQETVRKTLMKIVGPFPARNPLNAKTVMTIKKDGYKVENIIYESQPGFYVTSSLFIPDNLKKGSKAPAIIYCSGHADEGYRSAVYQHVILNLVQKGFIVLAFDPIGQGERIEYYDAATGKSTVGGLTAGHSYSGAQAFITGSSQAMYVIWDGIRAVDYLLTRPEVDAARIGMTGRSGGGTQTALIAAMDNRIKAAAPENYITSFTRLIQSIGPQDAEQNLLNEIEHEIDMADLLSVRAPKPTLMITTTRDMFNIEGARTTAKEVKRFYQSYREAGNFNIVTDDAPHASTKKNREAMYAFFQKHLNNPGDSTDKDIPILTPKELQVTETGQVATSLHSETVFSLNRIEAERSEAQLQASRKNVPGYFAPLLRSAKQLSGYKEPAKSIEPVFTGRFQREGYVIEKYFLKGEGDYVIPYLLMRPEHTNHKAIIYLHPSGKSAEASPGGEIEWLVKNGFTVLAPDMLGTGELGPGKFKGDSFVKGISYNVWFLSMLIGRSIVGIQAGDVVRLAHLIKNNTGINDIYGLARKEMAPVLLHAAAFDSSVSRIALIEPYSSYRSIVMNRFYSPEFISSTVPSALQAYDLPDLAASLAPRKLMIYGITDEEGKTTSNEINNDLHVIQSAYHFLKSDSQLINIKATGQKDELFKYLKEWIQ